MGLFELSLFVLIVLAAVTFCFILIEIDRRCRDWFDYNAIYRQNLGEIDGADIIQALKKKDRPK